MGDVEVEDFRKETKVEVNMLSPLGIVNLSFLSKFERFR